MRGAKTPRDLVSVYFAANGRRLNGRAPENGRRAGVGDVGCEEFVASIVRKTKKVKSNQEKSLPRRKKNDLETRYFLRGTTYTWAQTGFSASIRSLA